MAARLEALQLQYHTLGQQHEVQQQQLQQTTNQYQEIQVIHQTTQNTSQHVIQQYQTQTQLLQQKIEALHSTEMQLAVAQQQLQQTQATIRNQNEQLHHFREENLQLLHQKAYLEGPLQYISFKNPVKRLKLPLFPLQKKHDDIISLIKNISLASLAPQIYHHQWPTPAKPKCNQRKIQIYHNQVFVNRFSISYGIYRHGLFKNHNLPSKSKLNKTKVEKRKRKRLL